MQHLGFRSVFAKLFASVMLALILFAVAMVLLTQLVHDKDAGIRSEVVATQILGQIDPFLQELNVSVSKENRLKSRFMLAVVKKSFDIFDESLQAKMGLYSSEGQLLMQTDNSDLPLELPATPSLLSRVFPSFVDPPPTQQAQVYSSTGYTLLYESRLPPKKPVLSAALNLFTGTLLLLLIMSCALWWIARSMTWRINQMSQQMGQLGDGDFSVRVNTRGNDEIALLARGFNQAAQKIEQLINANNLLLAHASHELRTPITRIRLQIEMMDMLATSLPIDTKAKFDKRAQAINRDLSGLNDLVESILLVSRLDAGHAMQQLETFDLYDLVNQERQHFSESTLIGEHIVIDGQPPMLTHLIRNLLTNAMLHGEPPVTVLLYGVQNIKEAVDIPDYLLQSVLCTSLVDYNDADYNHYDESSDIIDVVSKSTQTNKNEPYRDDIQGQHVTDSTDKDNDRESQNTEGATQSKLESVEPTATMPAPTIYRNGETLIVDSITDNTTAEQNVTTPATATDDTEENAITSVAPINTTLTTSFINNYGKFTTDFTSKVKKAIWNLVPESVPVIDDNTSGTATDISDVKEKNAKANSKNNKTNNESANLPRKENLFKKHLKRAKVEPIRPLPKYVVLAVIDEGKGIPIDKREEIFSPFVRLQQKKKGSGLGLSLVSQIVTAHQGRITTDTINGYTRFLIVIPVKQNPHYNYNDHDNHSLKD